MQTLDFRKEKVYKAKPQPSIVNVPQMQFVMVDGSGAPENNVQFQEAMEILFGIVYTIKFWDKKHIVPPGYAKFNMTPLEGLWWMAKSKDFDPKKLEDWRWTVMIRVPDFVTPKFFEEVVEELTAKKQKDIYKKARLKTYEEGLVVQLMHIGPYDQEQEDINKLHEFANQAGYKIMGKHHELYFSDPRRTAPQKLKTLLRLAVEKGV